MPTPTYTPLANITLGSAASSVTFSNIPSTPYRDLIIIINGRSSRTADNFEAINMNMNNDTASNYSYVVMAGNGSTTTSNASTTAAEIGRLSTSSSSNTSFSTTIIQIMDYSATDKHKTALGRSSSVQEGFGINANAYRWANISAINSVKLTLALGPNFAIGSTFALYGIVS